MKEPVFAADGHTYERVCLEQWLASGKTTSPMTGEVLEDTRLRPNHAARAGITDFLDEVRAEGATIDESD